jgi:hypothetical protein
MSLKTEVHDVGHEIVTTLTGDKIDIYLYESSGYDDFIDNSGAIDKIKMHLLACHRQHWSNIANAKTMTYTEIRMADPRIHCMFYFIEPHRLKEIDVAFIKQLSHLVPIVPIISKADTMTVTERNSFIAEVSKQINTLGESSSCIYRFEDMVNQDIEVPVGGQGSQQPSNSSDGDCSVPLAGSHSDIHAGDSDTAHASSCPTTSTSSFSWLFAPSSSTSSSCSQKSSSSSTMMTDDVQDTDSTKATPDVVLAIPNVFAIICDSGVSGSGERALLMNSDRSDFRYVYLHMFIIVFLDGCIILCMYLYICI